MKNISIWRVIRVLLLIVCIAGVYAYMASVSNSRQRARNYDQMQRTQNLERIKKVQEQQEEQERHKRELIEKADNAEFQLNHWYEQWKKAKREQEHVLSGRSSRAQVADMKRKLSEAYRKVAYWGKIRIAELETQMDKAKGKSHYYEESINKEIERCQVICKVVEDETDDAIIQSIVFSEQKEDEEGFWVDGIRYVTDNPSHEEIRIWKKRYESLCRSKIRNMTDGKDVPYDMIDEDPCLVYLVLKSEAIQEFGDSEWFYIYEKMNNNQKYKLYKILYGEMYKYAKIKSDYSP